LEFGAPLLLHLILLGFSMLILRVVELIEKACLVHVIFFVPLLYVGPLQITIAQSTTEVEYVATALKFFG
jgi:uncharacterized membrane protein YiaA